MDFSINSNACARGVACVCTRAHIKTHTHNLLLKHTHTTIRTHTQNLKRKKLIQPIQQMQLAITKDRHRESLCIPCLPHYKRNEWYVHLVSNSVSLEN